LHRMYVPRARFRWLWTAFPFTQPQQSRRLAHTCYKEAETTQASSPTSNPMFCNTDTEIGRRRKVKCRPSNRDSTRCTACVSRNSVCIEQGRVIAGRRPLRRKELCQRITILENHVRADSVSSDEAADEDHSDRELTTTPRRRQSEINSVEDFLNGSTSERGISSSHFEDSLFANIPDRVSSAFGFSNPPVRATLFPVGGFKHEKDCKRLLAALRSSPNIREALEKQSHFWAMKVSSAEPNSGSADETLIQYARHALAGDNPIKIAKIVQAVASVTMDVRLHEKLVLIVDRLIVSDDEYLSTLEGMECTIEQGRLLTEMGQVRRSW
jgi:hypothetical protein